jgi:hypothetical protein
MTSPRRFGSGQRYSGVHNVGVQITWVRSLVRAAVAVLGLSLVLAACGGTDKPKAAETPSPQAAQQTDVPVPAGVKLTEYGTGLKFGQSATVAYAPNAQRSTILKLTVLSATKGTVADLNGYTLDDSTRASTPYYVRVAVENVGEGDVGQTLIPLFLVDNRNTLISASSFTNSFAKCPSTPLPTTFAPQASQTACLVYLAPDHGTLAGISFRAVQEYAPIVWTGAITVPKATRTTKKKSKS